MITKSSFYKYVIFVLINIFLVIIAGSVVRSTQSGMGCPDWPKCFGQYIPPTDMEQVLFQPNKQYNKGQFIRYHDSLWFAAEKLTTANDFNRANWTHYNKHGYNKIVIYQTWIEYINRLLGALLGIFVLIQAVWSWRYKRINAKIFWLSVVLVLLTGFQAWLGKTVVDSNLAVVKISIHLAGALALCFVQVYLLRIIKPIAITDFIKYKKSILALAGLSIVQFFMGVMVRQKVDIIAEKLNYLQRELWLNEVGPLFYIHRSFSLILVALSVFIFKKANLVAKPQFRINLILILLQMVVGIVFNYLDFPAIAQPLHLVLASLQLTYICHLLLVKNK